jgi:hypothetical protein
LKTCEQHSVLPAEPTAEVVNGQRISGTGLT